MPPQHPKAVFADGYVVGQRRRAQALQFPSREPEGKETRPPGAGGGCVAARRGWTCGRRFRCSQLQRRFLGEGRAAGDAPSSPKRRPVVMCHPRMADASAAPWVSP